MGLAIGAAAMVARRIGEKDPRGRRAGRGAGDRARRRRWPRWSASSASLFGPRLLAAMGASPGGGRDRRPLHAGDAGRQRHRHPAVPDQRRLPRRRRSAIAHAHAGARQRHQHRARSAAGLRPGAVPALGVTGAAVATTIGRGVGVLYQLARCARAAATWRVRREHLRVDRGIIAIDPAALGHGHLPGAASARRAGSPWCASSPASAARRSPATPSPCASCCSRCCRRGAWPTPPRRWSDRTWARPARARRAGGVARGALQPGVPGLHGSAVRAVRRADRPRRSRTDPAVVAYGTQRAAHRQRRVPLLRLRHGADAGVQRRGRHLDADAHQPVLLLALGDPARLAARHSRWASARPACSSSVLVGFSTMAVVSVVLFRRGRWKRVAGRSKNRSRKNRRSRSAGGFVAFMNPHKGDQP